MVKRFAFQVDELQLSEWADLFKKWPDHMMQGYNIAPTSPVSIFTDLLPFSRPPKIEISSFFDTIATSAALLNAPKTHLSWQELIYYDHI